MAAYKPLPSGQSEVDTVVLRLDTGREIRNWSRYSFVQKFLEPTPTWSFSMSDQDAALVNELVVEGAQVQLVVNDRVQCTGYVDRKTIAAGARDGTTVTVQGRDILGPVVDATCDPRLAFPAGITVPELVASVLLPFGITTIYNADAFNLNVVTGYEKGSPGGAPTTVQARVQKSTPNADGTVTLSYDTVASSVVTSTTRPDLHTLQVQDAKPHAGEGAYEYLDRILRRLGLTMWALADGSGVVIDKADFTSAPGHRIIHRRSDGAFNNVTRGEVVKDLTDQPSVIVATGFGGGKDTEKSKLRVIMVNELTGLDDNGGIVRSVQDIIDRYPSALVLTIRTQLDPGPLPAGGRRLFRPHFCKDDESKNLDQLAAFVRRTMAKFQQKALTATYDVIGHTQAGHPWSINTSVDVDDEVRGVSGVLWVREKMFAKSSSAGTTTTLRLIRPYTMEIGK